MGAGAGEGGGHRPTRPSPPPRPPPPPQPHCPPSPAARIRAPSMPAPSTPAGSTSALARMVAHTCTRVAHACTHARAGWRRTSRRKTRSPRCVQAGVKMLQQQRQRLQGETCALVCPWTATGPCRAEHSAASSSSQQHRLQQQQHQHRWQGVSSCAARARKRPQTPSSSPRRTPQIEEECKAHCGKPWAEYKVRGVPAWAASTRAHTHTHTSRVRLHVHAPGIPESMRACRRCDYHYHHCCHHMHRALTHTTPTRRRAWRGSRRTPRGRRTARGNTSTSGTAWTTA